MPQPKDIEDLSNRPPYEYYCITRHRFDLENENNEKPEDEQLDEDEIYDKLQSMASDVSLKPAAEHPEHKWIVMWQTWKMLCEWRRRASYTDPDNFSMYIYNDFNGYGLQELVENFVSID